MDKSTRQFRAALLFAGFILTCMVKVIDAIIPLLIKQNVAFWTAIIYGAIGVIAYFTLRDLTLEV